LQEAPDFVIAETFSWLGEALLAMERIEKTGMPSMVTMSFDKDPKSYDGHSPAECARALRDAGADIVGVNCLRNPLLLLPRAREGPGRPDVARGLREADVRVRVLQTPDLGRSRRTST